MREVASADRALAIDLAVTPATGAAIIDGRVTVLDLNGPASVAVLGKEGFPGALGGPSDGAPGAPGGSDGSGGGGMSAGADGSAESVTAVLGRAIAAVGRLSGGQPPDQVVIVHPATWGTADREAVRSTAADAYPYPVELLAAPVAAARCFRDRYALPLGTSVAVYGMDAEAALVSVLTRTRAGLEQRAQGSGGPLSD